MYEGAPDWPQKNRFWSIIEHYGVTVFCTAPTAIRAFMRWVTSGRAATTSRRFVCSSVNEPINPEAWIWYHELIETAAARSSTRGGKPKRARS
jgi:acetyl-CoA synthetase